MEKRPVLRERFGISDFDELKGYGLKLAQSGSGMDEIYKLIMKKLGKPLTHHIGPKILRKIVLPAFISILKSKRGGALRLPGEQPGKGKRKSKWIQHVKKFRADHPGISYQQAMKQARASYKK